MNKFQEWAQQNWNKGPSPVQQPQPMQGMGPQQSQMNGGYTRVSPGVYQDASGRTVRPQGGRMPPPQSPQAMPRGPVGPVQGMPRLPMSPPQMVAPNQFDQGQYQAQPMGPMQPMQPMQAQPIRRAQPTGPVQPVGLLSRPPKVY